MTRTHPVATGRILNRRQHKVATHIKGTKTNFLAGKKASPHAIIGEASMPPERDIQ